MYLHGLRCLSILLRHSMQLTPHFRPSPATRDRLARSVALTKVLDSVRRWEVPALLTRVPPSTRLPICLSFETFKVGLPTISLWKWTCFKCFDWVDHNLLLANLTNLLGAQRPSALGSGIALTDEAADHGESHRYSQYNIRKEFLLRWIRSNTFAWACLYLEFQRADMSGKRDEVQYSPRPVSRSSKC